MIFNINDLYTMSYILRYDDKILINRNREVLNGGSIYATGGTITYDGDYKIHSFQVSENNTTGIFTISYMIDESIDVSVLICGRGGRGGYCGDAGGGGGGGGGEIKFFNYTFSDPSSYTIQYSGSYSFGYGTTSFLGYDVSDGKQGSSSAYPHGGTGGASGNGNAGYDPGETPNGYGGGGGGFSGAATGLSGGPGILSSITGSSIEWGKGGKGGDVLPSAAGSYGGGGQGSANANGNGPIGSLAYVVIRYKYK